MTVAKWIDDGQMTFHLTAGGHRRVTREDLAVFMERMHLPLPATWTSNPSRVLIVDDDELDRQHIAFLIRKNFPAVDILEAENGFDMGRKITTFIPSLIILDLRMPGLDGFEVCKSIRSDPKLQEAVIVAMSSQDDDATKKRIFKSGADDFLSKNAESPIWIEKLREWLATRRISDAGK